jgi:hypothetical protein
MDGAFYILVNDGFGRTTRFDIGYANWEVTKVPDDIAKQVIDADPDTASQAALDQQRGVTTPVFQNKFLYRDRWWDPESDGTSLTKGENWTNWIVQEQLSIGVALPVSRTTAERNDNFPDGDPSDPDYDPRVRAFDQAVPVK